MTIRYLAQELYRLSKRVEELERLLAAWGAGRLEERTRLETELLQTRKERERLRAVLESKKEKPLV
jgi:septal ring factor EnvC (AmiA/AmiB activator)